MRINGRVWKYGDDINTDVIFPGKYTFSVTDADRMVNHALEDLDERFRYEMRPGDIIVAGDNWGCGSSREQAVKCLKAIGVGAIIAKSFSRIYFRNAINVGLPVIICPQIVEYVEKGDFLEIDFVNGMIYFEEKKWAFKSLPTFLQSIIDDGGMLQYLKKVNKE
jgi:3-isopropylmalate/(R)-2-methylmalate dehydratase small subunit